MHQPAAAVEFKGELRRLVGGLGFYAGPAIKIVVPLFVALPQYVAPGTLTRQLPMPQVRLCPLTVDLLLVL